MVGKKRQLFTVVLLCATASTAVAMDMDALSKELVNPIGMKWKLNNFIEVDRKEGDISSDKHTSTVWNIQPVMPVMLSPESGMTLMNRPSLPIFIDNPVPVSNNAGQFQEFDNITGIGDLTLQSSLGKMPKTRFGSYMWGLGASVTLPTASDDALGSEKYSAGPTGMLVGFTDRFTFGVVVAQEWSFAGNDNREDVNKGVLQPLYYMQLGNGWQIGDNPQWHAEWDKIRGERYTMPIGLGVFKTLEISSSPWRFGVTPRYYVKSSDRWGSDWGVNFTITKVVNSPIKM